MMSVNNDNGEQPKLTAMYFVMILVPVAALTALILGQYPGWRAAIGVGIFIYLAAVGIGGLIGFLFSLPRVLTQGTALSSDGVKTDQQLSPQGKRLLQTNTNLERVSDWLTTMLVGVGLTQITAINEGLLRFRDFIASNAKVFPCQTMAAGSACAGPNAGSLPAIAPFILIVGLVAGFLGVYVFTRLKLVAAFNEVENKLAGEAKRAVLAAAQELSASTESPGVKSIASGLAPSISDSLSLMLNGLYTPGKYQSVIDLGGKLSSSGATHRPEYWFYLAAAFGQKHHELLQSKGADSPEVLSARLNVLDCAKRAARLDASYKHRLAYIAIPGSVDDDLADFQNDPEFKEITEAS